MLEDKEMYEGLAKLLRKEGVDIIVWSDDSLMFTKFDAMLIVEDEKMVIFEYFLPVDFNIPTLGERIATFRLADPECFKKVRRFCNGKSRKKAAYKSQA